MRAESERSVRASEHHNRQMPAQRLLPALPRTSRYRFHDDDRDQSVGESRTTVTDNETDPDLEGES